MEQFNDHLFQAKINRSLSAVRKIISTNKNPVLASNVQHVYDDKFLLATFLTNTFISANTICLDALGLTADQINQLRTWASNRTVTLRLSATELCNFAREVTTDVDSKSKNVTEVAGVTFTSKVVTTVKEYFWKFDVDYELSAYVGTGSESGETLCIRRRNATHEIKTSTKTTPKPECKKLEPFECDISWLLRHFNSDGQPQFDINRGHAKCFTPRRNDDVNDALTYACEKLFYFCRSVTAYFIGEVFSVYSSHGFDLKSMGADTVFVPFCLY